MFLNYHSPTYIFSNLTTRQLSLFPKFITHQLSMLPNSPTSISLTWSLSNFQLLHSLTFLYRQISPINFHVTYLMTQQLFLLFPANFPIPQLSILLLVSSLFNFHGDNLTTYQLSHPSAIMIHNYLSVT